MIPTPTLSLEPEGFTVAVDGGDRIHFLDWGGPAAGGDDAGPGVVMVHGLGQTAWLWSPVARRLAAGAHGAASSRWTSAVTACPTLRPRTDAYDLDLLADDVVAVAEGSGAEGRTGVTLVGHGFGAIVAAAARRTSRDALRRPRPRRRRLGIDGDGDRHRCRRVPARPRRAARGHALAGGVPGRPARLRPGHLGRRPGSGRPSDGRRDACRSGRAGDPAPRARGVRADDVRVRPGSRPSRRSARR